MRMPDLPSGAPRQLDWLKRPLPLTIALLVAAAVGLGGAALAGAFSDQGVPGLIGGGHATTTPLPAVSLKLTPAAKATGVRLDARAKVVATGGTIRSVRVTAQDGTLLDGEFAKGHRSWTSTAVLAPGWRWFNDKEIHYRPKAYWPAGTRVTLDVGLNGVDAGNGVWGTSDRRIDFTIGQRHVSLVDVHSHKMTVTSGSRRVKVFPMSAGRPKYPTTNGIHFTLEKAKTVIMDSATVGIPRDSPDGYYEKVHWNVRISNTGEFVHAAPWSVGSQGSANVSHGCINLSVVNATWFYKFSQRGDIVQVVGSPKQPNDWALGVVDWNVPWSQWLSGSALH